MAALTFDQTKIAIADAADAIVTVLQNLSTKLRATDSPVVTSISPTSGPTGTGVSIVGTGFGTDGDGVFTSVTIGGALMSVTFHEDTSIAAIVPDGAVTGDIIVTRGPNASQPGFTFTVTA